MTATCVVSNMPVDTRKICIGQVHEQVSGGAVVPMVMIMFDLSNSTQKDLCEHQSGPTEMLTPVQPTNMAVLILACQSPIKLR